MMFFVGATLAVALYISYITPPHVQNFTYFCTFNYLNLVDTFHSGAGTSSLQNRHL